MLTALETSNKMIILVLWFGLAFNLSKVSNAELVADNLKYDKLNNSWTIPVGCNEDCYIDNLGFTMTHVNIWMVVIAWIFSTLLAFIIGRRKGKSGAGILAGILLGPIGVIVSFLLDWLSLAAS